MDNIAWPNPTFPPTVKVARPAPAQLCRHSPLLMQGTEMSPGLDLAQTLRHVPRPPLAFLISWQPLQKMSLGIETIAHICRYGSRGDEGIQCVLSEPSSTGSSTLSEMTYDATGLAPGRVIQTRRRVLPAFSTL